jgi:hypothetical protein
MSGSTGVVFYYREIDTSKLAPGRRECAACRRRIRLGPMMVAVSIGAPNKPMPPDDLYTLICERCRGTPQEMTERIYRRQFPGESPPVGTLARITRDPGTRH